MSDFIYYIAQSSSNSTDSQSISTYLGISAVLLIIVVILLIARSSSKAKEKRLEEMRRESERREREDYYKSSPSSGSGSYSPPPSGGRPSESPFGRKLHEPGSEFVKAGGFEEDKGFRYYSDPRSKTTARPGDSSGGKIKMSRFGSGKREDEKPRDYSGMEVHVLYRFTPPGNICICPYCDSENARGSSVCSCCQEKLN